MEYCRNSRSCGSIGCCSLHSNLNSLSLGVSTANHSHRLMLLCCNVISPQVSTANFACWLALVCCNLQSLSLDFSAASLSLIHCNLVSFSSEGSFPFFHAVKWLVFHQQLRVARSAWSLTFSFSTFRSFGPLSLQHIRFCLFLCHRWSSCSCTDLGASLSQSV